MKKKNLAKHKLTSEQFIWEITIMFSAHQSESQDDSQLQNDKPTPIRTFL